MSERTYTTWKCNGLGLLVLAVIAAAVVWPLAQWFADLTGALRLAELWTDDVLQQAFRNSVGVLLLGSALASLIALPVAFVALRCSPAVRWSVAALALIAFAMPAFLVAAVLQDLASLAAGVVPASWLMGLEPFGAFATLVLTYAVHYSPLIALTTLMGLLQIDASLEESARNLGAGRLKVWWQITRPLAMPGYLAGATLAALRMLEDAATPLVLGVREMLAPQLLLALGREAGGANAASPFAIALLLVAALLVAGAWSSLSSRDLAAGDDTRVRARRWPRAPARVVAVLALPAFALVALPVLGWLLHLASGALIDRTGDPSTALADALFAQWPVLHDSLPYIGLSAGLAVLLGASAAAARGHGPVARALRGATVALWTIPGLVLAAAYLVNSDRLDALGVAIPFGSTGLLAAVVALKLLPLLERLFAGRSVLDLDTGRPVAVLGLGLRATLPLLVAAFAFAAVGALAEISAMLVLVHTPPLPFTQTVYMALQGDAPALDWAVPGVLLTLIIVGLIATAVVLVRARRRLHSGVEQPFRLPAEWQRGSA
ncbi:MAG: ABC transporter permease subunit [Chromatiaceae bacterium]|nr:ABC transporter permease subunit [Chromatiaceae bacterium]MCP5314275.1 ABC transporter permease subunit [Chromatiaceae bacterium]